MINHIQKYVHIYLNLNVIIIKKLSRVKYEKLFNNPTINSDTMNYSYSSRYI